MQIVALRLTAFGDRELPPMPAAAARADRSADAKEARIGERAVYFEETRGFLTTPVYRRERLRAGHRIPGPAIVEQMDSTTVILAGQEALVDDARQPRRPGAGSAVMDRITLEVIGAALLAIAEEMGEALIKSVLLDQHQGAAGLLDRALRRAGRGHRPGRAHPDAPRLAAWA